jgi:hypothetical protein
VTVSARNFWFWLIRAGAIISSIDELLEAFFLLDANFKMTFFSMYTAENVL